MPDELYPLPMAFPSSAGPISFLIDRAGWECASPKDSSLLNSLPIDERLYLRRGLEAQVQLANQTPKGDR